MTPAAADPSPPARAAGAACAWKRWLLASAGMQAGAMAVAGVLLLADRSGLPEGADRVAAVAALVLLIGGVVALLACAKALRRALDSVATTLAALANEDDSAADLPAVAPEADRAGPAVSSALAGVRDRVAALVRQRDEQKLAGRLAQRRCRQFEAVLQAIPDALVVIDAMDRIVVLNEAAARLFAVDSPAAAKPLTQCIADPAFCNLLHTARGLHVGKEVEYSLDAEGGRRIFNAKMAPLAETDSDASGGAVVLLHDVTRERHAARMKTEFVAHASHELRTPLGGIKAYLEMLSDGEVQDEASRARFYQVMQGEVERLGDMVDNILNIARIEAGIVKVAKEQVPLTAIVQEVIDTLRPQARSAEITLIDELLPVFFHVYADREMLRRAVFNLVSNAIKYTPRGGTVAVRMRVDEAAGRVTVDVNDTGVGIGEQDLPRLFGKFFRAEGSRKMAKGTGLGLVLVKEVVETVHGGRVSVKSVEGKGSTFSLTLPLLQDKQPALSKAD